MTSTATQRPRRATIEDVAARAGVSVATVSRALRGLPNVAASTRERVAAVAEELHYAPDPAASRLAAGRTHTVTVVVPTLCTWYFSTVVAGVEAVCSEAGYDVLVLGVGGRNDLSRLLSEGYHIERRTDGLVIVDVPITPNEAASITSRGVEITTVGRTTPGHPSVQIDDDLVGRLAAEHLADLGHVRFGLIGGAKNDPMNFEVPKLRCNGFFDSLEKRGFPCDRHRVAGGNFDIDGGHHAMLELLDHPEPPTAVFSLSDEMAFGALMALQERGLRAGEDVSIIGVDDHEFSRVVSLTTIRQPVADHGVAAARLLLDATAAQIGGRTSEPVDVVAPIELIVRSTTGRHGTL